MGSLYLSVLFLGIINSRTVQPVASEERAVSYRERAAGVSPVQETLSRFCSSWLPLRSARCAMRARLVGASLRNGLAISGLWYSLGQLVASEERPVHRKRAAGTPPCVQAL